MPPRGAARLRSVQFSLVAFVSILFALPGCEGIPGSSTPDADVAPSSSGDASDSSNDTEFLTLDDDEETYGEYRIVAQSVAPALWDFGIEPSDPRPGTAPPTSLRFVWDFGDGGDPQEGQSLQYAFSGGGVYPIKVTAYNRNEKIAFVLTLELEVPPIPNQAPVAEAGDDDRVYSGDTVCLDGSASRDADGDPLQFAWRQIAGSTVALVPDSDDLARVCFVAPEVNEETRLVFGLSVNDGEQLVEDSVAIDVLAFLAPAGTVVADAGVDSTATAGDTVTLDGSASQPASDVSAMIWSWRQTSGTAVELSAADAAITTFVAPEVEGDPVVLGFELTVTEGESVATDDVLVTVEPLDTGGDGGVGGPPPSDLCPGDPLKTNPGVCGCGVPDDDTDSDGVEDCIDECPADPAKTEAGDCGCGVVDTDSDGDGVANCIDECPSDPDKTEAGVCGCGVPDADSDSDGTEDCLDACPSDPNKTDPGVCGCGVADADLDGDGGVDCIDGCPADPNKTAPGVCGCGVPDIDSDSDGTADCIDNCPSDPFKTEPGACGCGVADDDSDSDGVVDCLDGCPADPDKTEAGLCGCGVADTDSDSDGTPDCSDNCPSDPNKTEPGVCGCGVADDDSDGDGVEDCDDVCPGFDDSVDNNNNGTPDGCDPAQLSVGASSLDFGLSSVQLDVDVWNSGGGTLSYTTSTNAGWLSVSPASGSSTGEHDTLTVSVDRSGLGAGNHEGEVYVTPSVGSVFTITALVAVSASAAPMTTASHTSGVAPLSVFFDAVDGGGLSSPAGGDHCARHYAWDFGDSGAGNWENGAHKKSKNEATGHVAAHVYRTPGTYTATLVVTEPNGSNTTYQQQIDVKDPATESGWQTFYVSSSGNDGHPGTQAQPFASFGRAMSELGTKRRILFRRGDTFNAPSKATISAAGPGIIGAYGNMNDPRPVIVRTGSSDIFDLRAAEWRIMDLELNGDNNKSSGAGLNAGAAAHRQSLLLNVHIHGFYMAAWNTYAPTPIVHDHIFVVDCEMNGQGNKGMFIGGSRLAILGNYMHDIASHIVRPWHCVKGVISENTLRNPLSGNAAVIKLHNAKNVSNLPDGRWIIIAGNQIRGKAAWNVTIGTQDSVSNETVRDVVVERNVFEPHPELQISCRINAQDVTFRNNIASYTGTSLTPSLVQVTRWGIEPSPTGARIFNNSVYRADGGNVKLLSSAWSDTLVYNNIVYASSGTPTVCGSSGVLADNLTQNPLWENPGSGDFRLKLGSPAIKNGRPVPVTDDFLGKARPLNGADIDLGACEYAP